LPPHDPPPQRLLVSIEWAASVPARATTITNITVFHVFSRLLAGPESQEESPPADDKSALFSGCSGLTSFVSILHSPYLRLGTVYNNIVINTSILKNRSQILMLSAKESRQ
jgi:hypothetical protein